MTANQNEFKVGDKVRLIGGEHKKRRPVNWLVDTFDALVSVPGTVVKVDKKDLCCQVYYENQKYVFWLNNEWLEKV